jgi:Protein of unknown function (DUF2914)
MQTIDPADGETQGKTRRLRRLAWSIGAAVVCIAISLIILSLLLREPDRATGVASHSEDSAVENLQVEPETLFPSREHLAPDTITPPVVAVPAQPEALEQSPEPTPQPSPHVGLLPPAPPPPAVAIRPAEPRRAESTPAEPKSAPKIRRPAQIPAASGHVAQIVLASDAGRPGEGDPISSPIVLAQGQEKRIVLYTDLRGLAGQTVSHRWEYEGRTVAVIPFKIGGDRWRVHSNKRVTGSMKGSWRAVVVDAHGTTLASRSFVVH